MQSLIFGMQLPCSADWAFTNICSKMNIFGATMFPSLEVQHCFQLFGILILGKANSSRPFFSLVMKFSISYIPFIFKVKQIKPVVGAKFFKLIRKEKKL